MRICVVLTVCFFVIAHGGFAKTIRVGPTGDYHFIQEAIDAAQPGDEILLSAMTFTSGIRRLSMRYISWTDRPGLDNLMINKSVNIRGSGISNTYLRGGAHSSITISETAEVSIKDLTIGTSGRDLPRIVINGDAKVTFDNVIFENASFELSGQADVHVQSGRFTQTDTDRAVYIAMEDLAMLHLTNCTLQSTGACVRVNENSKLYVDQSELSSGGLAAGWCTGITITGGQAELTNSQIHGSDPHSDGVRVSDGGKAVLKDCSIRTAGCAVRVSGGSVEAIRSTISSKEHTGIVFYSESSGVVDLCHIDQSKIGIEVDGEEVVEAQISGTTITNNSVAGIKASSGEIEVKECEIHSNGEAGISLDETARAIITNSTVKNNDGWGIAVRQNAVAVGWGNTVTGNQRDLFGVSDWLVKPEQPADKQEVSVPREMPTIEEAIYRVANGGTIVIEPGKYSDERVAIYKRINIQGQGHNVVLGGITLFNELGDVHLGNLAIIGDTNGIGILVSIGTHLQLEGSVVSNWSKGLDLLQGSTATVSSSTISENSTGIRDSSATLVLQGCSMSLNGYQAIDSSSEELSIDDCAIRDNGRDYDYAAIRFSGKNALIRNSIIKGNNNFGIEVGSGSCDIESCSISGNGAGVSSNGTLVISGSRIMKNTLYGIVASRGALTVVNTEVTFNKYGVFLDDRGEDIDNLVGRDICIRDNSSADLRPSIEQYPWPREFEVCVPFDKRSANPLIEDFCAIVTNEGGATLSWTNPTDFDLAQVRVCRKAGAWPADHTDGEVIFDDTMPVRGVEIECSDQAQIPANTYYYVVFAADINGNWNDSVQEGLNALFLTVGSSQPDQPPLCKLQLLDRRTGRQATEFNVGQWLGVCLKGSEDDQGIKEVRFSSDEVKDGRSTGHWTGWYAWGTPENDWDSTTQTKDWMFATSGQKELWVELRDVSGNSTKFSVPVYVHPGYAVIVAGKGGWREKRGIDHSANNAYRALWNLGFDDDHIFYLNSVVPQDIDDDGDDEVDRNASLDVFKETIQRIAEATKGSSTPVLIYLVGHGDQDCFIFDSDDSKNGYLWVSKIPGTLGLTDLLSEFTESVRCVVIIGSCYSGCFITSSEASHGSISATNRVIITASHDDEERYMWGWVRSSDTLWEDLMTGSNLRAAFENRSLPGDIAHLWLDDNGDHVGHPPSKLEDDGNVAEKFQIGMPGSHNLKLKPWVFFWLHSPGELRVYDAAGHVTGLVNGAITEEIPDSLIDTPNNVVVLFSIPKSYHCEVVGTKKGMYDLDCVFVANGKDYAVAAKDVPTLQGAIHKYSIDWDVIAQGEEGMTLQVDDQGDNEFEQTYKAGTQFSGSNMESERTSTTDTSVKRTSLWGIVVVAVVVFLVTLLLRVKLRRNHRSS